MKRKCPICGTFFSVRNKKQIYCGELCREQHKGAVKKGRAHCVFDIEAVSEDELKLPPTRTDIFMIISLLKDFGVYDFNDMPEKFVNYHELMRWKNKKIEQVFVDY